MAGEGQYKEQAKYQWDKLDMEGCRLINGMLTATPEKVEWPEDAEPKFTRKRTTRAIRVANDTNMKRYMYHDNNIVATGEPIQLETSDTFFDFCYHPERKENIKIVAPARSEAEYVVTAVDH